jgi:hypothetical protein
MDTSKGGPVPSILTGELEQHRRILALGRHRRMQFQNRGTNTAPPLPQDSTGTIVNKRTHQMGSPRVASGFNTKYQGKLQYVPISPNSADALCGAASLVSADADGPSPNQRVCHPPYHCACVRERCESEPYTHLNGTISEG